MIHNGSQVSDHCPFGYLFINVCKDDTSTAEVVEYLYFMKTDQDSKCCFFISLECMVSLHYMFCNFNYFLFGF